MTPETSAKRMTGPQIEKIFAPTPRTYPSLFASIAWLVTEFEKPLIGTSVPAPAWRAIVSKTPRSVRVDASAMIIRETSVGATLSSTPSERKSCLIASPSAHIAPPKKKALTIFCPILEGGLFSFIICFLPSLV